MRILAPDGRIFRRGEKVELSCDVPRRTTAVTWYHGSRILGTAKILPDQDGRGGSHHTSAPILLPWDLEYDSEPYVLTASFDPKGWLEIHIQINSNIQKSTKIYLHYFFLFFSKLRPKKEQFDQLVSQSPSRRKQSRKRSRRASASRVNIFPTVRFEQNKIEISEMDSTIEGAITCVAKLKKYAIAIASNPIHLEVASKLSLFIK